MRDYNYRKTFYSIRGGITMKNFFILTLIVLGIITATTTPFSAEEIKPTGLPYLHM